MLHVMHYKRSTVAILHKFEVEMPSPAHVLLPRDIHIATMYGKVYCLLIKRTFLTEEVKGDGTGKNRTGGGCTPEIKSEIIICQLTRSGVHKVARLGIDRNGEYRGTRVLVLGYEGIRAGVRGY